MLSALDKEQYWRTVEASLTEILGMGAAESYQKVLELRLNIAKGFQGESLDIAYHDEPLKVAVDLAGHEPGQFDFLALKDQYAAIRERYMPIGGNQQLASVDDYFQFARAVEGVVTGEIPIATFPLADNWAVGVVGEEGQLALPKENARFLIGVVDENLRALITGSPFSSLDDDFKVEPTKKRKR